MATVSEVLKGTLISQTLSHPAFEFDDAAPAGDTTVGAQNRLAFGKAVEKWSKAEKKDIAKMLDDAQVYLATKESDSTIPKRFYGGLALKLLNAVGPGIPAATEEGLKWWGRDAVTQVIDAVAALKRGIEHEAWNPGRERRS